MGVFSCCVICFCHQFTPRTSIATLRSFAFMLSGCVWDLLHTRLSFFSDSAPPGKVLRPETHLEHLRKQFTTNHKSITNNFLSHPHVRCASSFLFTYFFSRSFSLFFFSHEFKTKLVLFKVNKSGKVSNMQHETQWSDNRHVGSYFTELKSQPCPFSSPSLPRYLTKGLAA